MMNRIHLRTQTAIVLGLFLLVGAGGCARDDVAHRDTDRSIPQQEESSSKYIIAALGGEQFVHRGDAVNQLAYSPDGKYVAAVASSYVGNVKPGIQIWDTSSGETVGPPQLRQRDAACMDWSPDGESLVLCDRSGNVEIWDFATGNQVRRFSPEDAKDFRCVAWSSNGEWIAACQPAGNTHLWRTKDWHHRTLEIAARQLAISPDSTTLVLAQDQDIEVWNLGGERRFQLELPWEAAPRTREDDSHSAIATEILSSLPPMVNCLAVSPDSKLLAIGGSENQLELRDLQEGKLHAAASTKAAPFSVAFHPDGAKLATGSYGTTGDIWSIDKEGGMELIRTDLSGFAAAFSPDGKTLALSTRRLSFVDVETGSPHDAGHIAMVNTARFTSDGKFVLSTSSDGTLRQWNPTTGKQVRQLEFPEGVSQLLAISADDTTVAGANSEGAIVLWDRETAEVKTTFADSDQPPVRAAFSADGKLLATVGPHGANLWDIRQRKVQQSWKDNAHIGDTSNAAFFHLGDIAFIPGGPLLAAAYSMDGRIVIFNMQDGSTERTLAGTRSLFWSPFALSPDGIALAYTSGDRVNLWNPQTGRDGVQMQGRFISVTSIAYSSDGKLVAAGGRETNSEHESTNVIRVWSGATGEELLKLNGHHEWIRCLAFSPSGEMLVSGSQDTTLVVWDIQEAKSMVAEESTDE